MRRALVFGVTGDRAFAAGTALRPVRAGDPGFAAEGLILHDALGEGDAAAFRRPWPRRRRDARTRGVPAQEMSRT